MQVAVFGLHLPVDRFESEVKPMQVAGFNSQNDAHCSAFVASIAVGSRSGFAPELQSNPG